MSLINDGAEASEQDGFFIFHIYYVLHTLDSPRRKATIFVAAHLVQALRFIRSPLTVLSALLSSRVKIFPLAPGIPVGSAPARDRAWAARTDTRDLLRGVTGAKLHPEGNSKSFIPPIYAKISTDFGSRQTSPQFTNLMVPSTDWGEMRGTFKKKNNPTLLYSLCV